MVFGWSDMVPVRRHHVVHSGWQGEVAVQVLQIAAACA